MEYLKKKKIQRLIIALRFENIYCGVNLCSFLKELIPSELWVLSRGRPQMGCETIVWLFHFPNALTTPCKEQALCAGAQAHIKFLPQCLCIQLEENRSESM